MQQPKKWTCCIGIPLTAEEVHCGTWIPYATAQAPQIHLSKGQYTYEEAMTRSKLEHDSQITKNTSKGIKHVILYKNHEEYKKNEKICNNAMIFISFYKKRVKNARITQIYN